MEEANVIFEVTKVGFAVNTKWNVFVDGKVIGKIDFKKNLTQKLSKGKHAVQYKVGVQKTKVLEINVEDKDIIVECVWDGTVKNFHVVGGESNNTTNNMSKTDETKSENGDCIYCSKCGTKISKESSFCANCGNKINDNPKEETTSNTNSNNSNNNGGIISAIITIVLIIGAFWWIYGGNGVDGEYWFSDGSGYVKMDKDLSTMTIYDEYNNYKGRNNVRFTEGKTFVFSDGLLEYTGTISGKKLTVKCENDKMGGFEATRK